MMHANALAIPAAKNSFRPADPMGKLLRITFVVCVAHASDRCQHRRRPAGVNGRDERTLWGGSSSVYLLATRTAEARLFIELYTTRVAEVEFSMCQLARHF